MRWACMDPSRMPDRHKDPHAWEATWQRDFDMYYGPSRAHNISDIFPHLATEILASSSDTAMIHEQSRRALSRLQGGFVRNVVASFAEHNFEQKWRQAGQQRREEAILGGILRAFNSSMHMDLRRPWCPDSSLRHLAGNDGMVYIQTLKDLLPSDVGSAGAPIEELLSIPCPVVDEILTLNNEEEANTGHQISAIQARMMRQECMVLILGEIMCFFLGTPEQARHVVPKVYKPNLPSSLASIAPAVIAGYMKHVKQQKDALGEGTDCEKVVSLSCFTCGVAGCDLPEDKRLRECPPCKLVGRSIAYCSKDCQAADWKRGTPVPHKIVCGKEWSAELMVQHAARKQSALAPSAPWLPPAATGFKRSPALLYQMAMLKDSPDVDYVLMNADNAELKLPIMFVFSNCKSAIVLHRNRAMYNGARESVVILLRMLCRYLVENSARDTGISQCMIVRQLEVEYGVDLGPAPNLVRGRPTDVDTIEFNNVKFEEIVRVRAALEKSTILEG